MPTYEHTMASLQHFVRSSDSGLAADHDLADRVERCVAQSVKLMSDCAHRIAVLDPPPGRPDARPGWWRRAKYALRAKRKLGALVVELERWTAVVERDIRTSFHHIVVDQLAGLEAQLDSLVVRDNRMFSADRADDRPSSFHVPSRYLLFTGRSDVLASLHELLAPDDRPQGHPQDRLPVCLCGAGGVGKTEAATEYTHRHWFGL